MKYHLMLENIWKNFYSRSIFQLKIGIVWLWAWIDRWSQNSRCYNFILLRTGFGPSWPEVLWTDSNGRPVTNVQTACVGLCWHWDQCLNRWANAAGHFARRPNQGRDIGASAYSFTYNFEHCAKNPPDSLKFLLPGGDDLTNRHVLRNCEAGTRVTNNGVNKSHTGSGSGKHQQKPCSRGYWNGEATCQPVG